MNTGSGIHPPALGDRAGRRGVAPADDAPRGRGAFAGEAPPSGRSSPPGSQGTFVRGGFAAYARSCWPRLHVTAFLLTEDPRAAEELARRTLAWACARWRRIPRDDADFHLRRSLVRRYLRGRARWSGGRLRVVRVLRYWEELSEVEIAQLLGCSVGAVRALVRRAERRGLGGGGGRAEFVALLRGFVPVSVPLKGVVREGARRRRRRAGVAAAGCALLLAPPAVVAVSQLTGGEVSGSAQAPDDSAPESVRIVAPGERVAAAPDVDVWLSAKGKHWSSPQAANQFRAVADGRLGSGRPGVSVQGEPLDDDTYFLSGLYHGLSGDPSRITVRVGGKDFTANVLTLAGSPGWGVWYVRTPLPGSADGTGPGPGTGTGTGDGDGDGDGDGITVTVRDAGGDVAVRSDAGTASDTGVGRE